MSSAFAVRLRDLLAQRGVTYRALAPRLYLSKSALHDYATGRRTPTLDIVTRLDAALQAGGELVALAAVGIEEADAVELARRVAASDVSDETLRQLQAAFDDLAVGYTSGPPADLLPPLHRHLAYIARLLDGRKTLAQHRQLLVTGGWLALLAATVNIDLHRSRAGAAHLATAAQMAQHADHPEITAWTLETQAWQRLTAGDHPAALTLSLRAQEVAPHGSSAHIQATAQEGRAHARLGHVRETHDALDRTARLAATVTAPRPGHHYDYDPGKAVTYVATTLAWLGDPAAVDYARAVAADLDAAPVRRPRRAALARLDLAFALVAAGDLDEAAAQAMQAVTSGRLVPSSWWRVREVLAGVERIAAPEATELREACEAHRPDRVRTEATPGA